MTAFLAVFAVLATWFSPLVSPAAAEWSAPRTVYIDETGQPLDQVFLDVWRDNGGADSYGYPISPEITLENGHIVQYFQYARFEYWPEGDAEGNHFKFGNIGAELRPLSLTRTLAAPADTKAGKSAGNDASLQFAKSWLPITEADIAEDGRFVEATGHSVAGPFREFWEATGEDAYLGNPLTETYESDGVTYQVFERGQLRTADDGSVEMVPLGKVLADRYRIDQQPTAQGDIPSYSEDLFVEPGPSYGNYVAGGGEVWVDINLSAQYLVIYQGNTVIGETYVSTGRPGFDTPTGTFYVQAKYLEDDMEGVLGGEYYNVPSVPDVLYFTNGGHAIHGAYWHNNFGAVMSHGCVNLPLGIADFLYSIAPMGMRIEIHY